MKKLQTYHYYLFAGGFVFLLFLCWGLAVNGLPALAPTLILAVLFSSVLFYFAYTSWQSYLKLEELRKQSEARWQYLVSQYGPDKATFVWNKTIWMSAPVQAVLDMFGPPHETANEVTENKITEVFKYNRRGNTFGLQITLINGAVKEWKIRQ